MPGLKRPHSATHESAFAATSDAQHSDSDPEDLPSEYSASDEEVSGSDSDANDHDDGREHYEPVGKSQLRSKQGAALGPQYAGSRIRRQGVDDNDDEGAHDPFAEDYSSDESELDVKEEDGGVGLGSSGSDDDMILQDDEDTDATSFSGASDEDDVEDDDADAMSDDGPTHRSNGTAATIDRSALQNMMNGEHRSVAASLNAANEADAKKGRAVKRQRQTYDGLLNARIRLQPGMTLSTSLQQRHQNQAETEAFKGAEEAALTLWNTLNRLRTSLRPTSIGTTTKQPPAFTASSKTTTHDIWTNMSAQDTAATPHRHAILTKWSQKTAAIAQSAQTQNKNRLTGGTANQATTFDILQTQHLAPTNITRLVERSRRPQSSNAEQVTNIADNNAPTPTNDYIYDDADFYATLLKDLIDSRAANSATTAHTNLLTDPASALRAAQRAAKLRRPVVDTKASKGRKLKYTIHEKLQNFMAPEDRGRWGERQREELFGSLLGVSKHGVNGNGDGYAGGDENGDGLVNGKEEESLRLFRS